MKKYPRESLPLQSSSNVPATPYIATRQCNPTCTQEDAHVHLSYSIDDDDDDDDGCAPTLSHCIIASTAPMHTQ